MLLLDSYLRIGRQGLPIIIELLDCNKRCRTDRIVSDYYRLLRPPSHLNRHRMRMQGPGVRAIDYTRNRLLVSPTYV
jgi:hypothetical protein